MKIIYTIFFLIINLTTYEAKTKVFVLDKLENPGITNQNQRWSFFTDGVMGGISEGSVKLDKINNVFCYRMTGNVTTENNGGFIQIRSILKPSVNSKNYEGVYLKIYGNNKKYYLHLRTPLTLAPWQYYSHGFFAEQKWIEIKAPFSKFKKSNFYQPSDMNSQQIKSIGLVAGFDNFKADICLAEIGFY